MAYFGYSSSSSSSSVRCFVHGNVGAAGPGELPIQILEVRLGLISTDFPSSDPVPMASAVFPFSLRQFFQYRRLYVLQILSSLNLHAAACDAIARKIAAFVAQSAGGNTHVNIHLVAVIDYIQIILPMGLRQRQRNVEEEETMILDEVHPAGSRVRGAPETVLVPELEELELWEEEELGDCSICLDQLQLHCHGGSESGKKTKVIKIRCGHVYHKSCLLTWLSNKNSCPLCRAPLFFQH